MPRVSVLLTCYNHLEYLPACVEGLLAQTMGDFEVVALDDGSADGTRDWLRANLGADPRVRLEFNSQNLGTYGTLNRGLELATARYVAILNDDDVWLPEKLDRQVADLEANPRAALSHTGGWFIDGQGARIEGAPLGFPFPRTPGGDVYALLIGYNKIIASSALFRRDVVAETGPFDAGFYGCGDWHMWLRIAERHEVEYVDEPLTLYRIHGENACLDVDRMNRDSLLIRKWLSGRVPSLASRLRHDRELRAAFVHNWACLGTELVWAGEAAEGRRAYLESLRLQPTRFKSLLRLAASFLPRRAFRALR
jgi:glycosyltransferase involved in cell wall biosynthesis